MQQWLKAVHGRTPRHCLGRMARTGLDAILPAVCLGCGKLFKICRPDVKGIEAAAAATRFRALMCVHVCAACGEQFEAVRSPLCLQCGLPFVSPHGVDHVCGTCQSKPPVFHAARAAGLYQGVLRTAIQQHKYAGREGLAEPLGQLLWWVLSRYWQPSGFDSVVPVPLHPRRLRERGFNQAQALIRKWPRLAGSQGCRLPDNWIDTDVLERCRPTRPQTGLRREERAANLQDAFVLKAGARIEGARILIVDDVLTTGATVDACARTLLRGGAAQVQVLTLARAVQ
jgi:ComF family protein